MRYEELREFRCKDCNKLLAKVDHCLVGIVQIKCNRCKSINFLISNEGAEDD